MRSAPHAPSGGQVLRGRGEWMAWGMYGDFWEATRVTLIRGFNAHAKVGNNRGITAESGGNYACRGLQLQCGCAI